MFNKRLFTTMMLGLALISAPCFVQAQDDDEDIGDDDEMTCTNFSLTDEETENFLIDDSGLVQAESAMDSVGRALYDGERYSFKQKKNSSLRRPKVTLTIKFEDSTLSLKAKVGRKSFSKVVRNIDSAFFIKNAEDHTFDGMYFMNASGVVKSINLATTGRSKKPYAMTLTNWGETGTDGACYFEDESEEDEFPEDELPEDEFPEDDAPPMGDPM